MKNLIFILLSLFCFAKGQNDSLQLKLNELEQKNQKIETLIKKVEVAEKKQETAFFRLKLFLKSLMKEKVSQKESHSFINIEAVKVENEIDPVTEIDIPDGIDTIRASWLYRLFHSDKFIYKKYKIVNNEKIYLD